MCKNCEREAASASSSRRFLVGQSIVVRHMKNPRNRYTRQDELDGGWSAGGASCPVWFDPTDGSLSDEGGTARPVDPRSALVNSRSLAPLPACCDNLHAMTQR